MLASGRGADSAGRGAAPSLGCLSPAGVVAFGDGVAAVTVGEVVALRAGVAGGDAVAGAATFVTGAECCADCGTACCCAGRLETVAVTDSFAEIAVGVSTIPVDDSRR